MKPLVSIVLSVFKNRGYLTETMNSVINQSFKNYEFIVIDDGSSEDVVSLLNRFKEMDNRIVIKINKNNIGLTKSLHKGVAASKGKYIARIDEGDCWEPEKLEKQIQFLETHSDYILVGTQYHLKTKNNKAPAKATTLPVHNEQIKQWLEKGLNPFLHSSIVFKNNIINYNASAVTSQDYELYMRFYHLGKMKNLKENMVSFLITGSSISSERDHIQFFNHKIIHDQFLKSKHTSQINKFIREGVDFDKKLFFQNLRLKYMYFILCFLRFFNKKSFMGKILKNVLIPDYLIYNIKKNILNRFN